MGTGKRLTWVIFSFYTTLTIANATIAILYAAKIKRKPIFSMLSMFEPETFAEGPSPAPRLIGCTIIFSANKLLSVMYIFFIIYDGS
jgi:hypothetical protein